MPFLDKDDKAVYNKAYQEANRVAIAERKKLYRQKRRKELSTYQLGYHQSRLKSDPAYKLAYNLRCRLHKAINIQSKSGSAVQDLGCSIPEFKAHIESLFTEGMSWDNHGEWHLDHIKPLASFDLSDRDQFLEACHYKNYQPLWALDNLKKGMRF